MAEFNLADHQRLSRERDFAAYRAVVAIDAAICYCRQGDAAEALNILTRARSYYELADSNLQSLKNHKTVSGIIVRALALAAPPHSDASPTSARSKNKCGR